MKQNPLRKLADLGQSVWIDFIRRGTISSGELQELIQNDGIRGVTSNPSIFEKAITGSHDYDTSIRALSLEGKGPGEIYERLAVEDIRMAADLFRPVYDRLNGGDGFVSLEVSPHLAYDTEGTITEARRLWKALDRPNVMIKVPATRQGLGAIRQLTGEGINVNVTLLFGLPRYREVAEAYLDGLEAYAALGKPLERLSSVASFFLSRIDVLADPLLEKFTKGARAEEARSIHGLLALSSAKIAYEMYKRIFGSIRFRKLAERGARSQRLLWASTSTKNPCYSDVKYVEPLIGPGTINTMPMETLNAYRDHGQPAVRLEEHFSRALQAFRKLREMGLDMNEITGQLEEEGVRKFIEPYDRLMKALEERSEAALREPVDRLVLHLNGLEKGVSERLNRMEEIHFCPRLWRKDPALWGQPPGNGESIRNGLGWLHVAEKMEETVEDLLAFSAEVRKAGFRHVVHMGMGGSSLAPLAIREIFPRDPSALPLSVLDTTDPATILALERKIPLADTLFIVASKSGTTAEPWAFGEYFYAKVKALKAGHAGENFLAVTDPGSALEKTAEERKFRRVFYGFPDIGGRYSALSYFGLLPSALMGVNVSELLVRALRMVHACSSCVPNPQNPGLLLGTTMGELAGKGRDKVTFLLPDPIQPLGLWLEQLIAESTGKEGKGILPVAGEPLDAPSLNFDDRLFVYIRLRDETDVALEKFTAALARTGTPLIRIQMDDRWDVAQEFFRWEMATAAAGSILGINPFDQPNVQESKDNTNRLLKKLEEEGRLPEPSPILEAAPLVYYGSNPGQDAGEVWKTFFDQVRPGDYIALQAYLTETPETTQALQGLRKELRDGLGLATTLGYGPRFLHSTGQYHKGGPDTGLFLQLTADDAEDAPIPGVPYTFGDFKQAQALGDLEALQKHGRRVMRVHLGADVRQGLISLGKQIHESVGRSGKRV